MDFLKEAPFKVYLTGSRFFAQKYPDVIKVKESTDYDFCAQWTPEAQEWCEKSGHFGTHTYYEEAQYEMDNTVIAIFVTPDKKVQLILRDDLELYRNVMNSITPEFYEQYLWKSSSFAPKRQQIQSIMNQLFKTASYHAGRSRKRVLPS